MRRRGYMAMVLASLSFSLMGVAVRLSHEAFSLSQLVVLRGSVALLILAPWAWRHSDQIPGKQKGWLLLRALAGTVAVLGNFHALQTIPLATATVLNQTSPLFAVLLVWILFGKPPARANLLGLGGAFCGILLLFPFTSNGSSRLGMLAGLASGLLAAVAYIAIRRLRFSDSSQVILLWFSSFSTFLLLPFALSEAWPGELNAWCWGVAAGCFAFLGQSFLIRSLAYLTATAGSTAGLLGSVFAAGWGWLLFAEALQIREWVGIALIVTCGAMPVFFEGNRKIQEQPSPFRWQRAK
jgi:drug/metabolite transporter (DMT)-like permease